MKPVIHVLAALLFSTVVVAKSSEKYGHESVAFDPDTFNEQRAALVREVKRGERYVELTHSDRQTVLSALDSLGSLLGDLPTIDALTENEKLQVFNLQETVNTLLTDAADGSRLVCARETKTGTHRPINVCKTVAQREREREDSVKGLKGLQRAPLDCRGSSKPC